MISILCCICINLTSIITWENMGELQSALRVYDLTIGYNGYLYAGATIDSTSQDCGRVFVSQNFWTWQRCTGVPWVPGDTITGVYALYNGVNDTLFAGVGLYHSGDTPRVFKSEDGGASWTALSGYGTFRVGTRVCALLEDNIGNLHLGNNPWGMQAAIPRYSTDRGATWQQGGGTINYNAEHYCFCQTTDNTIYFGSWGTGGGVHYSTDNGVTWNPTSAIGDAGDTYTIVEYGTNTIIVGTEEDIGRVYMSTDRGTTWAELGDGYLDSTTAIRSLYVASDGYIYAGTEPNAEVFVSLNSGATWVSTGMLSGATIVYSITEGVKYGVADMDSFFLFTSTGPNGDVFRGLLYTIGTNESTTATPGFSHDVATIHSGPFQLPEDKTYNVFDINGRQIHTLNPVPGIYFITEKGHITYKVIKIK